MTGFSTLNQTVGLNNPLQPSWTAKKNIIGMALMIGDSQFILYDRSTERKQKPSVSTFGPYFVEQYILMEVLSKQEVASNVLDYYVNHREKLQSSLDGYNEAQGKGFICWRFLMNEVVKAQAAEVQGSGADSSPTDMAQLDCLAQ